MLLKYCKDMDLGQEGELKTRVPLKNVIRYKAPIFPILKKIVHKASVGKTNSIPTLTLFTQIIFSRQYCCNMAVMGYFADIQNSSSFSYQTHLAHKAYSEHNETLQSERDVLCIKETTFMLFKSLLESP